MNSYLPDHAQWHNLYQQGVVSPYAWHLTAVLYQLMPREDHTPQSHLLLLLALLTAQSCIVQNHTCLDLNNLNNYASVVFANQPEATSALPALPSFILATLQNAWQATPYASLITINPSLKEHPNTPLVLDEGRLYLQRYWLLENQLAAWLRQQATRTLPPGPAPLTADDFRALTRLELDSSQTQALEQAWQAPICVITGGPGTGKTTIMSVFLAAYLAQNPTAKVQLCAPTGKAQARLQEALVDEVKNNLILTDNSKLRDQLLQVTSATIHRLLQPRPPLGTFRHNAQNPLACDLLVVDEASMIGLNLMTQLFSALSEDCRVILLGDSDQLAAVETGMVLADICEAWQGQTQLVRLTQSHRFDPTQGIGKLKELVRKREDTGFIELLKKLPNDGVLAYGAPPCDGAELQRRLKQIVAPLPFYTYRKTPDIATAFTHFDTFRILCATHHGLTGVHQLNLCLQEILQIAPYAHGFPLLITQNDYHLQLFNGDIGLCWQGPSDSSPKTYFPDPTSSTGFRSVERAQLPPHVPAFAMTIHKAQGSGFERVLLLLPTDPIPLLTCELIYTGLTRAKNHCTIWAHADTLTYAIERRTRCMSGLPQKLKP